jgi:hypothetical protein
MGFDPCNFALKIWKSIWSPTPNMGVHLGVWVFILSPSLAFPGTQDVTLGLLSWPATLQALALVASPRLRLRHLELQHALLPLKCYKLGNVPQFLVLPLISPFGLIVEPIKELEVCQYNLDTHFSFMNFFVMMNIFVKMLEAPTITMILSSKCLSLFKFQSSCIILLQKP